MQQPPETPAVLPVVQALERAQCGHTVAAFLLASPALYTLSVFAEAHKLSQSKRQVSPSICMHSVALGPTRAGKGKGAGTAEVGELEQNIGLLLIDYFRLYGRALAWQKVGVSAAQGFGRRARDRGDRFSVMDPLDASNDVSRCAHAVSAIAISCAFLCVPSIRSIAFACVLLYWPLTSAVCIVVYGRTALVRMSTAVAHRLEPFESRCILTNGAEGGANVSRL
jgi:hypothetical protein